MTIKEALSRTPTPRPTEIVDIGKRSKTYEEIVRQKGIAVLRDAGIPALMSDFRDTVGEAFPDAKMPARPRSGSNQATDEHTLEAQYESHGIGTVGMSVGWNYRESEKSSLLAYGIKQLHFDAVTVLAEPLTETLIVQGQKHEVIPRAVWGASDGKVVLEDAIAQAYRNPATRNWPPIFVE